MSRGRKARATDANNALPTTAPDQEHAAKGASAPRVPEQGAHDAASTSRRAQGATPPSNGASPGARSAPPGDISRAHAAHSAPSGDTGRAHAEHSAPVTSGDLIELSVVLATYNRGAGLKELLQDLAVQTVDKTHFEVIVVDDGSREPVAPLLADFAAPYALKVITQKNGGAAVARDVGVRAARGDIVVITDDDMRVDATFLAEHLRAHQEGATVVLGHIAASHQLANLPIYERFHAHQLARFVAGVKGGRIKAHGVHVCTGNVSFRREDYLRLGGFDAGLKRSEDRELGVRLEADGARLAFALAAVSRHESDHNDLNVWLKRAFAYGVYDRKIAQKHPGVEMADPWRFFFLVSPLTRPLLLMAITAPEPMALATRGVMAAAGALGDHGLERAAISATTLAYGLEYFRGMRTEAGSLGRCGADFFAYWRKRAQTRAVRS